MNFNKKLWIRLTASRCYSSKVSKFYSETILLPKTSFDNFRGKSRVEREQVVMLESEFDALYDWQAKQSRESVFVLHDGPPYANGHPHFGHALNKVLKDVTNRYKLLRGHKIHYVPGWDCHGLPIELKALTSSLEAPMKDTSTVNDDDRALAIRTKARSVANHWVEMQKAAFRSWGVMGDWNRPYHSYDTDYIARELDLFHSLYERGFVFREYKPVHWSYAARTALADAELVYNEEHESSSVYIKFKLNKLPALSHISSKEIFALIWTTTPWSLPANRAICYADDKQYCVVSSSASDDLFLVATDAKSFLEQVLSTRFQVVAEVEGSSLATSTYVHPFTGEECPLLSSSHVTMTKGTGLVHVAPAHGQEDFVVALQNKISLDCIVDEDLRYEKAAGPELEGKFILDEGSQKVLQLLGDKVFHSGKLVHSYPYDWRTKTPVILRASLQWFMNTDMIKDEAIKCLRDVEVYPSNLKASMIDNLKKRPFWCISRQRVWGVPIPVFYEAQSKKPIVNRVILDHLLMLLRKYGPDFWWSLPREELLPASILHRCELPEDVKYERGNDILDIWFDSGSSWHNVLRDVEGGVADLYLEGIDQVGAWFQSSLLTSCALRRKAPFKTLYFHGFTLDENGRKMSKSLGNVIDPKTVIEGGNNLKKEPSYGVDVLRWWFMLHGTGHGNVPVASRTLAESSESYNKIRITFKFLLGLLNEFDSESQSVSIEELLPLDRYLLHQLYNFKKQVSEFYDCFSYHLVGATILRFVVNDVSKIYCHLIKDRVYCSDRNSFKRRSCLTVVGHMLTVLTETLAPVMPFLCEDVYLNHPLHAKVKRRLFQTVWTPFHKEWCDVALASTMSRVFGVCDAANQCAFDNRLKLRDVDALIHVTDKRFKEDLNLLQKSEESSDSQLCELLQVARVIVSSDELNVKKLINTCHYVVQSQIPIQGGKDENYSLILSTSKRSVCERCRRRTADDEGHLCRRCNQVVHAR